MTTENAVETDNNYDDNNDEQNKKSCCSCMSKITDVIISFLENSFAKFGLLVGRHPFKTILCCLVFALLCAVGIIRFEEESRSEKLWVDQESQVVADQQWVRDNFPTKIRYVNLLMTKDNVLTPEGLEQLIKIDNTIKNLYSNSSNKALHWENIKFNQPPISLLELWSYNHTLIKSLTKADILRTFQNSSGTVYSPARRRYEKLSNYLSEYNGNSTHPVTSAGVTKMTYFIKRQDVLDTSQGRWKDQNGSDWEKGFALEIKRKSFDNANVFYSTLESFLQAGLDAIGSDFGLLFSGYALIIGYVAIQLGKFSRLQHKVWLALTGVLCVGLSIGVSYGLCSAFGVMYGPVHSILPFLMLGIGVDDIFVIIQTWDNRAGDINDDEEIAKKISRTMRHAGVAITVTSFTDVCAFLIGATTVLPALRSFCIYAGVGILMLYIFASSFFVAFLAIDAKRQRSRRDACCTIKLPESWEPLDCSKKVYLQNAFKMYSQVALSIPGKILIFLVTGTLLGFGFYGLFKLNQDFDPNWFLPKDSDEILYRNAYTKYFPSFGINSAVYVGNIDYFAEQEKLHSLHSTMQTEDSILDHTVKSWYEAYIQWASQDTLKKTYVSNNRITDKTKFYEFLHEFIMEHVNVYGSHITYDKVGNNSMNIKASRFLLSHKNIDGTQNKIKAMESLRDKVNGFVFSNDQRPFAFADRYINWQTNKIIGEEIIRNLSLASACVFLVTLVLIANIWTSLIVLTCVAFTLVDICGYMYFWGLSLDTIISTILVVALGFAVDYAAHVGHAFMAARGGDRNKRAQEALVEIGPAVLNGGISTFLAFCLLAGSESYAFETFFKVFFLVVSLGLWHGLIYLPVVLSLIGPSPYANTDKEEESRRAAANNNATSSDSSTPPMALSKVDPEKSQAPNCK